MSLTCEDQRAIDLITTPGMLSNAIDVRLFKYVSYGADVNRLNLPSLLHRDALHRKLHLASAHWRIDGPAVTVIPSDATHPKKRWRADIIGEFVTRNGQASELGPSLEIRGMRIMVCLP